MDAHDESDFDARHDPQRDASFARALRMVDGPDAGQVVLVRLQQRIVAGVVARQEAPWVEQVARPARRALPWAAMLAAASLLIALTLPSSLAAVDELWPSDVFGESSVDVSLGLPTSPDALLQESMSR
jgi:hypothetical protein